MQSICGVVVLVEVLVEVCMVGEECFAMRFPGKNTRKILIKTNLGNSYIRIPKTLFRSIH